MKISILILFTFAVTCAAHSQAPGDSTAHFVFLPGGLHFAPLKTHTKEPRVGVVKFLDAAEMKVDIGNSIDIFGLNFHNARLTAGIDFFAFAFVTGAQGLRLQIDAIDGFFGGNLTYSHEVRDDSAGKLTRGSGCFTRVRISSMGIMCRFQIPGSVNAAPFRIQEIAVSLSWRIHTRRRPGR